MAWNCIILPVLIPIFLAKMTRVMLFKISLFMVLGIINNVCF